MRRDRRRPAAGRGGGRGTSARAVRTWAEAVAEARRALAAALRRRRHALGLTQVRLAALLGSSQSRVAKMEAADAAVSLELLMRALVALGVTRVEVGQVVGASDVPPARNPDERN